MTNGDALPMECSLVSKRYSGCQSAGDTSQTKAGLHPDLEFWGTGVPLEAWTL